MRIRVIGVGTAHGDDAAGLAAAAGLASGPLPEGVEVVTCERPGPDLPGLLADADAVVVIDALAPSGAPGRVRPLAPDELARTARLSSHSLGVPEALALAQALGRCCARVEVLGIEAERSQGDGLSAAARRGVDEAVARVRARVTALAAAAAGSASRAGADDLRRGRDRR